MSNDNKIHLVSGEAYYAAVHVPDQSYNIYKVDVVVDRETKTKLEGLGLKPLPAPKKSEKDYNDYDKLKSDGLVFRFKRKAVFSDNTVNKPPLVVDASTKPMTDIIGNGSKVKVRFSLFNYTNHGGGTTAILKAIQVLDLVEYVPVGSSEGGFQVEEGFVSKTKVVVEPTKVETKDSDNLDKVDF